MDMRAELGLVGSIGAVNQLMTIIEQGRPVGGEKGNENDHGGTTSVTGQIMEIGK